MAAVILLAQIVISLVVAALSLPALLASVPALREQPAGLAVATGVLVVTFVGIRFVWPRRKE